MSVSRRLDFDLENLPVDVFDLTGSGLTAVESLTDGHGMGDMGASTVCPCICVAPYCSCVLP